MTARSRQAYRLAGLLQQRLGQRVTVEYHGAGTDPTYSGWRVSWGDGPTREEMRQLIGDLAADHPEVAEIAAADLRFDRGPSDQAEAVALLLHLDAHPDQASAATTWMVTTAFDTISNPDRADPTWQRRGRALIQSVPGRHMLTGDAIQHLARTATSGGWAAVLAWLDTAADTADAAADALADGTITSLTDFAATRRDHTHKDRT